MTMMTSEQEDALMLQLRQLHWTNDPKKDFDAIKQILIALFTILTQDASEG